MILTSTPLRVSFFGGGTDLPEYSDVHGGSVISTSINTSMFIAINESPRQRIKACYDEIELVNMVADLKHERIRETLMHFGIVNNLEVSSFCSIPTKGTGLGSSSTYTVGLCNALARYTNTKMSRYELAEAAYFIERVRCRDRLGRQDQYAAAFGGFNCIIFKENEVNVIPVNLSTYSMKELESNLLFFYTGNQRHANDILEKQSESVKDKVQLYNETKQLTKDALSALQKNKIDDFGSLLDIGWSLKKKMSDNISNPVLDEYYLTAMKEGALGGKLLGAGSSGFLMFYAHQKHHQAIAKALKLQQYKFNFSSQGSEIAYDGK